MSILSSQVDAYVQSKSMTVRCTHLLDGSTEGRVDLSISETVG